MSHALDDATKAALAAEVERLVSMGMERKKARQIVWEDYLEEQRTYAEGCPAAEPDEPVEPVPPVEVPLPVAPKPDLPQPEVKFFTPERLQKNKQELERVKRLLGLRSNECKTQRNPPVTGVTPRAA